MKFRLQIRQVLLISPERPHHMVLIASLLDGKVEIGDAIYLPTNSGEDIYTHVFDLMNMTVDGAGPEIGIASHRLFDPAIVRLGIVEGDGKVRAQKNSD